MIPAHTWPRVFPGWPPTSPLGSWKRSKLSLGAKPGCSDRHLEYGSIRQPVHLPDFSNRPLPDSIEQSHPQEQENFYVVYLTQGFLQPRLASNSQVAKDGLRFLALLCPLLGCWKLQVHAQCLFYTMPGIEPGTLCKLCNTLATEPYLSPGKSLKKD